MIHDVRLAYVDESATADRYFLGAVVMGGDGALSLGDALDTVMAKASGSYPGLTATTELHGHSISHGKDEWKGMAPRARLSVYDQALPAIAEHPVEIYLRGVDTVRLQARYSRPYPPHDVVLQHLLERLDEHITRAGTGIGARCRAMGIAPAVGRPRACSVWGPWCGAQSTSPVSVQVNAMSDATGRIGAILWGPSWTRADGPGLRGGRNRANRAGIAGAGSPVRSNHAVRAHGSGEPRGTTAAPVHAAEGCGTAGAGESVAGASAGVGQSSARWSNSLWATPSSQASHSDLVNSSTAAGLSEVRTSMPPSLRWRISIRAP